MWRDACAVALAELPEMTPARLNRLLADMPPDVAWEALATGDLVNSIEVNSKKLADALGRWRAIANRVEPLQKMERYAEREISVWHRYGLYLDRLKDDEHAPAVLFAQGDANALAAPTVAIIGTRQCSPEGRSVAKVFGAELAEAGVSVVSGLALGIDGAAHAGALESAFGALPIGVVGCGLDVPYPKRHTKLWEELKGHGLLISESPLGTRPEPWRFPARNRIIAGLADLVLVIESHEAGGSLLTVNEAADRGVPIMAVPGSIWNPACKGSNRLIADGAPPACSTQDVLDFLALELSYALPSSPGTAREAHWTEIPEADQVVLDAVGFSSTSTDEILLKTCLPLGEVAVALARLESLGLVIREEGWWFRVQATGGG